MVIDQSGRIEETNRHTIIALADKEKGYSIEISSSVKKELLETLRKIGKPKAFSIQIFAITVFLTILKSKYYPQLLIIDMEYPGHENTIKNIILTFCRKFKIMEPEIYFSLIGKKDPAHVLAIEIFRGYKKANLSLKFNDFKGFFRMRNKRSKK